jgi:Asp-tRNA(Asn)/Glu-tRNA(Gln) amidotransferase A subunit family amidase
MRDIFAHSYITVKAFIVARETRAGPRLSGNGRLASYLRITPEQALAATETADAEIVAGRYRGPLHGVPLGIKDLFWTKGVATAAGTMIHRGFVPDEDATAVARLRQAGAILLRKVQMTEGAYSDHHPAVVPPTNSRNRAYWTGISSSGPAVATAAGLCSQTTILVLLPSPISGSRCHRLQQPGALNCS